MGFSALASLVPGCDGFVLATPADMAYFTGFSCPEALLLLSAAGDCLVTDARYTTAAERTASCRVKTVQGGYAAGVAEAALELGLHVLGFQQDVLSAGDYLLLADRFTMVPIGSSTQVLRAVKTAEALEGIRRAQSITDRAFSLLTAEAGMTERQLKRRLENLLFDCGADGLAFDTIVAGGENGACPHAVASDKPLARGELITLDFGAVKDGWCSDMTRTVALGEPGAEEKQAYALVLEAHEEGAARLREGVPCAEADSAARAVFRKAGKEAFFTHSLGHGVGLEIHELPMLSQRSKAVLAAGEVVTVEPGLYFPGRFGIRTENMYAITRDGAVNLTAADKKLQII